MHIVLRDPYTCNFIAIDSIMQSINCRDNQISKQGIRCLPLSNAYNTLITVSVVLVSRFRIFHHFLNFFSISSRRVSLFMPAMPSPSHCLQKFKK